jgi:hypothetical protein
MESKPKKGDDLGRTKRMIDAAVRLWELRRGLPRHDGHNHREHDAKTQHERAAAKRRATYNLSVTVRQSPQDRNQKPRKKQT